MSKVNIALINMGETLITSLIQELGPHKFAIALSNANSHGKAFVDAGYEGALKRDERRECGARGQSAAHRRRRLPPRGR